MKIVSRAYAAAHGRIGWARDAVGSGNAARAGTLARSAPGISFLTLVRRYQAKHGGTFEAAVRACSRAYPREFQTERRAGRI